MLAHLKSLAALGLVLLVVLQGCASAPENTRVTLSEDARASLDNVGVVAVGLAPEPEALGPVASVGDTVIGGGAGLLIGGALGLGVGVLVAGSLACGPAMFACLGPALAAVAIGTTVGAAAGTTVGVIIVSDTSLPTETETQLESALVDALVDYDLPAELKNQVLVASTSTPNTQIIDLGQMETLPSPDSPDYGAVIPPVIGSVLEIGIIQIALVQIEDEETQFSLLINIYGRLYDPNGQEDLWSNDQIVYASTPADISDWTEPEDDHLRTEINGGLKALGIEISTQLFGDSE